ncbi:MAG: hypothetical protein ACRCYU_06485 [Nocardioides sp.]
MDLGALLGGFDADQIADLADVLVKNRGSLELLGKLPGYLEKVAVALDGAGDQAKAAGLALVGDDGESGVRAAVELSAQALTDIASSMERGLARISDAADGISRVPLLDGPADKLANATTELAATTQRLTDLASAMGVIGETLATVGQALAGLGDRLGESGGHARGFAGLGSAQ